MEEQKYFIKLAPTFAEKFGARLVQAPADSVTLWLANCQEKIKKEKLKQ